MNRQTSNAHKRVVMRLSKFMQWFLFPIAPSKYILDHYVKSSFAHGYFHETQYTTRAYTHPIFISISKELNWIDKTIKIDEITIDTSLLMNKSPTT